MSIELDNRLELDPMILLEWGKNAQQSQILKLGTNQLAKLEVREFYSEAFHPDDVEDEQHKQQLQNAIDRFNALNNEQIENWEDIDYLPMLTLEGKILNAVTDNSGSLVAKDRLVKFSLRSNDQFWSQFKDMGYHEKERPYEISIFRGSGQYGNTVIYDPKNPIKVITED